MNIVLLKTLKRTNKCSCMAVEVAARKVHLSREFAGCLNVVVDFKLLCFWIVVSGLFPVVGLL